MQEYIYHHDKQLTILKIFLVTLHPRRENKYHNGKFSHSSIFTFEVHNDPFKVLFFMDRFLNHLIDTDSMQGHASTIF